MAHTECTFEALKEEFKKKAGKKRSEDYEETLVEIWNHFNRYAIKKVWVQGRWSGVEIFFEIDGVAQVKLMPEWGNSSNPPGFWSISLGNFGYIFGNDWKKFHSTLKKRIKKLKRKAEQRSELAKFKEMGLEKVEELENLFDTEDPDLSNAIKHLKMCIESL